MLSFLCSHSRCYHEPLSSGEEGSGAPALLSAPNFSLFLGYLPDPVLAFNRKGERVWANPAADLHFPEMRNRLAEDHFQPFEGEIHPFTQCRETGGIQTHRFFQKEGGRHWECMWMPFCQEPGEAVETGWVVCLCREVTAQQEALEKLRAQQQNLDHLVDARTAELQEANARLQQTNAHIQEMNARLQLEIGKREEMERERRELENRLQQTEKWESLALMAGGIAHDFNNLLLGILGHGELAQKALPKDSPVSGYIRSIMEAGTRASELSWKMLTFSGHSQPRKQQVNLNGLLERWNQDIAAQVGKKASLRYVYHPGDLRMHSDEEQLRHLLNCLIQNSLEALPERGGLITVRTGKEWLSDNAMPHLPYLHHLPEGSYVFLEVEDNGCGMGQDALSKCFDPFFTTKFTGRGLGLASVLGIVRAHQGDVRLRSLPGEGTRIRVLFPSQVEETEKKAKVSEKSRRLRYNRSVLLIDDEKLVRYIGGEMLHKLGFSAQTVSSATEGLRVLKEKEGHFDCLILDYSMPEMNGATVYPIIRERYPDLPIILSSGYRPDMVLSRFPENDQPLFLQKPYSGKQMGRLLSEVLRPSE